MRSPKRRRRSHSHIQRVYVRTLWPEETLPPPSKERDDKEKKERSGSKSPGNRTKGENSTAAAAAPANNSSSNQQQQPQSQLQVTFNLEPDHIPADQPPQPPQPPPPQQQQPDAVQEDNANEDGNAPAAAGAVAEDDANNTDDNNNNNANQDNNNNNNNNNNGGEGGEKEKAEPLKSKRAKGGKKQTTQTPQEKAEEEKHRRDLLSQVQSIERDFRMAKERYFAEKSLQLSSELKTMQEETNKDFTEHVERLTDYFQVLAVFSLWHMWSQNHNGKKHQSKLAAAERWRLYQLDQLNASYEAELLQVAPLFIFRLLLLLLLLCLNRLRALLLSIPVGVQATSEFEFEKATLKDRMVQIVFEKHRRLEEEKQQVNLIDDGAGEIKSIAKKLKKKPYENGVLQAATIRRRLHPGAINYTLSEQEVQEDLAIIQSK